MYWKFILPWVRKLVYRTGKLLEAKIQKLSDEGWVLVSQSNNRASFTRDGLTLVLQVIQHQIFLSGTGIELTYADLEDIHLQGKIPNDMTKKISHLINLVFEPEFAYTVVLLSTY